MMEKQLQNMVINDIENSNFAEKIIVPSLTSICDINNSFNPDIVIKDLYESNIRTIINSLQRQDFDIINGKEIKNISMGKDRLFTDVLIKGVENSKYYVIELKVSKSTGRQTVTELMAYRHEIKNHLPFISNEDVVLIVVSLEYSSLLRHAVSSLLLDNIPVLCLRPIIEKNEVINYIVEDVISWTEGTLKKINKKMLEGYSINLFSKLYEEKIEKKVIDKDRIFAIEYYKAEANMCNSNGICVIWDHYNPRNSISNISTDYAISFFKINPYCIAYENLVDESDILSTHILDNIHVCDNLENSGLLIDQPSSKLESILSKKYWPQYGEPATFYLYEEYILNRGKPIYFDAWGRLGQRIKDIYNANCETLFKEKSYTEPSVFMKILNYIFEEYPFYSGFGNGEYFYFGVYLKSLEILLKDYSQNASFILWNKIEKVWFVLFCSFFRYPNLRNNNPIVSSQVKPADFRHKPYSFCRLKISYCFPMLKSIAIASHIDNFAMMN